MFQGPTGAVLPYLYQRATPTLLSLGRVRASQPASPSVHQTGLFSEQGISAEDYWCRGSHPRNKRRTGWSPKLCRVERGKKAVEVVEFVKEPRRIFRHPGSQKEGRRLPTQVIWLVEGLKPESLKSELGDSKTLDLREAKALSAPIQGERKALSSRRIDNLPSWSRPLRNQNQNQNQLWLPAAELLGGSELPQPAYHSTAGTAPLTAQSDILNQEPLSQSASVRRLWTSHKRPSPRLPLSSRARAPEPFPPPPPTPRHRIESATTNGAIQLRMRPGLSRSRRTSLRSSS
ncbi:hypothetical protein NA56DRAFT_700389 [Hyaloscypha hepaticicola]|uniref:Uncharacterized protein n=1 Tax=Hyaloscypha hepaticicola TaxID=2082293 RepID=A0A2J6QEN1_9HELO|nr:hypothetical protein NA56DRAFT_700389 [Hyaloscypha hepaticicola]